VHLVIDAERIDEALGRTDTELAPLERYLTRDSTVGSIHDCESHLTAVLTQLVVPVDQISPSPRK